MLKLLEKELGETPRDIDIGKGLLKRTPEGQKPTLGIDKWNSIKSKSFFTGKEKTVYRVEKNISANPTTFPTLKVSIIRNMENKYSLGTVVMDCVPSLNQ